MNFIETTQDGKPKKTLINFKAVLLEYGITLQYNMVKREIYYFIEDAFIKGKLGTHGHFDEFITYCEDICAREGFGTQRTRICNWIYFMANEEKFNHIRKCLETCHNFWTNKGTSEFDRYIDCITFKSKPEFSRLLFKKALWQSVAMAHNEDGEYGADGALTLQGLQGIGKTSLIRVLCDCFGKIYFKESANFDGKDMKDKVSQNTAFFMCELGEAKESLEYVNWMKAFITNPSDEFRDPYARTAKKYPRLTTFYITINDATFLKDVENRRYWTVEITDIDLEGLKHIVFENLWAEVYSWYLENPTGFRLTTEERLELNNINKEFRKVSLEEQVLTDCLDWAQDEEDWEEKTATHIATGVFDLTGQRIAPNRVSSTLRKMGYSKDTSPKRWRMLHGYSLYNIPRFVSKPNIFNPFEEKGKMGRDK